VAGKTYEDVWARAASPQQKTLIVATITAVTPSGTAAPLTGNVEIVFSVSMDTTQTGTVELQAGAITVTLPNGNWVDGRHFSAAYSDLALSTTYTVKLSGFATKATGTTLPADNSHSFITVPLDISVRELEFPSAETGYSALSLAKTLTITNNSSYTLDGLSLKLEGDNPAAFVFSVTDVSAPPSDIGVQALGQSTSGLTQLNAASLDPGTGSATAFVPLAAQSLAPGQTLSVRVMPAADLAAKAEPYTARIRVTSTSGIDEMISLSFKVVAGGGGIPQTGDSSGLALIAIALMTATGLAMLAAAYRHRTSVDFSQPTT
jgi:hypothetical protein